jgi:Leucine-rich repeat (LRR) protein
MIWFYLIMLKKYTQTKIVFILVDNFFNFKVTLFKIIILLDGFKNFPNLKILTLSCNNIKTIHLKHEDFINLEVIYSIIIVVSKLNY